MKEYLHEMRGICVGRIVETSKGFGVVTAYNRLFNSIDVALPTEKLYSITYEDIIQVVPLILKLMK